jgi:hypothetical protein
VPETDVGRRGGENRVGECMGFCLWPCLRAVGTGAADRGLLPAAAPSGFRVWDRRGGGRVGFSFSSSSCISFADLKEDGESGVCSLPIEVEGLRRVTAERFMSSDCGRAWREPRCGGGFGGGGVVVLDVVNFAGFCLIGGDFIGSFCDV